VDLDRLAEINARLSRARQDYGDALTAEHKAKELSRGFPSGDTRKPIQSAHERVRLAAEEYQQALDEFIKFTVTRRSA
jgi:hypothetical protein